MTNKSVAPMTTTKDAPPATRKPKKGRSPGYPGVDLERALELTRVLYKQERQHPTAAETVAQHWGMKSVSSQFLTGLSALKKFGLLDALPQRSVQSGHVKVSDLALNIILDERAGSPERDAAIRQAALKPDIHANLWREYNGELPSDPNLRFHLVRDLKFTEGGASEFIVEFRRTITFAGLSRADALSDRNSDKMEGQEEIPMSTPQQPELDRGYQLPPPIRPASGQIREVPIPIQGSAWPMLKASFPLSEDAWTQMLAVLNAMKPGLIEPKKDT